MRPPGILPSRRALDFQSSKSGLDLASFGSVFTAGASGLGLSGSAGAQHGNRHSNANAKAAGAATASQCGGDAAAVQLLTQHRDEAAVERRLVGEYRQPAGLRPAGGRELRDDFEKMPRVGGQTVVHAAGQDQIVSEARSRSTPRRQAAYHTSGLNQCSVAVRSASAVELPVSRRLMWASSCRRTDRSCSPVQSRAVIGSNRRHRRMPQTTGIVLSG